MIRFVGRNGASHRQGTYDYDPCKGTIVVNTGLSVRTCGHIVDLIRDNDRKTAIVRVRAIPGYKPTGDEIPSVKLAADLLADRTRRVLANWTVISWEPNQITEDKQGSAG